MKPELLVRSALIVIYAFLLRPFPEPYLGRKSRTVRHVKRDPTYICIHTAVCAKFNTDFKERCTVCWMIAVGCWDTLK